MVMVRWCIVAMVVMVDHGDGEMVHRGDGGGGIMVMVMMVDHGDADDGAMVHHGDADDGGSW
jgi:hypothetical protein